MNGQYNCCPYCVQLLHIPAFGWYRCPVCGRPFHASKSRWATQTRAKRYLPKGGVASLDAPLARNVSTFLPPNKGNQ
jgi:hypothetical protein